MEFDFEAIIKSEKGRSLSYLCKFIFVGPSNQPVIICGVLNGYGVQYKGKRHVQRFMECAVLSRVVCHTGNKKRRLPSSRDWHSSSRHRRGGTKDINALRVSTHFTCFGEETEGLRGNAEHLYWWKDPHPGSLELSLRN